MTDGEGDYGNSENCRIKTLRPLAAHSTEFVTESCCDHLTIAGNQHGGEYGPQALPLDEGTELVWYSDGSVTDRGFKVCASEKGSFAITATHE